MPARASCAACRPAAPRADARAARPCVLRPAPRAPARSYAVTLSTASAFLQDAARWEAEYCAKGERAYRPPPEKPAPTGAGGATPGAGLATPARRAAERRAAASRPLVPRPVDHPLWRNKKAPEARAPRCLRLALPWPAAPSARATHSPRRCMARRARAAAP